MGQGLSGERFHMCTDMVAARCRLSRWYTEPMRSDSDQPRPLAVYIRDRMNRLGATYRSLAGDLGHKTAGLVSHVLSGRKAIPPGAIEEWIVALRVPVGERDQFREWALTESSPDDMRVRFDDLLRREQALVEIIRLLFPKAVPGVDIIEVDRLLGMLNEDPATFARAMRKILRRAPGPGGGD